MQIIKNFLIYIFVIVIITLTTSCGPLESNGLNSGILNTGGTDNPRELIGIAYNRIYKSNRIIGARNVLKRAIEQSKKNNDFYALAVSYNMMGYTFFLKEKSPNQAEYYCQKALIITEENELKCEQIHSYIGLALYSKLRDDIAFACSYEKKANILFKKIINSSEGVNVCEGGQRSISIVSKRLSSLKLYLNCGTP
nr:hypothetical protein [uncultured Desulfobacter sp.]